MSNSIQNKNNFYIDITNTYSLINSQDPTIFENVLEMVNEKTTVDYETKKDYEYSSQSEYISGMNSKLISSDKPSKHNRVLRTRGIIISDSYNNIVYPIKNPRLDTAKFDLLNLTMTFKEQYGSFKLNFLPWHFIIEFIKTNYFIFNTRPIDQKFPLTTNDVNDIILKNSIGLNEKSKKFFKYKPFDYQEALHILIIGDSNIDVYTKQMYEILSYNCIGPILRQWGYSKDLWDKVWFLNIGKKFNIPVVEGYIKS